MSGSPSTSKKEFTQTSLHSLSLDQGDSFSQLANEQAKSTPDAKLYFYLVFSNMREVSKNIHIAIDGALTHVANRHTIFAGEMQTSLNDLYMRLERLSEDVHALAVAPNAENVENLVKHVKKLNRRIDKCQLDMVNIIGSERVSLHSSEMYLTFLTAMRTFITRYVSVAVQSHALSELVTTGTVLDLSDSHPEPEGLLNSIVQKSKESLDALNAKGSLNNAMQA